MHIHSEDQPPDIPLQKNKKWRPSILAIVLVSLCCVSIVAFSIYSINLVKPENSADKTTIQGLVDQFIHYLSSQDIQKAYDLFSTEAKKNTPRSKLENLVADNYSVLFSGYQRNEITSIEINSGLDLSPDAPEKRVAKVSGLIYYDGGATGKYDAYFDRENNAWRIYTINFTIPQLKTTPTEKTK